jgi:hypothetical protein
MESRIGMSPGSAGAAKSRRVVRLLTLGMAALLLGQFLAGMFVNLYVGVPSSHPGTSVPIVIGTLPGIGWAIASGGAALAIHTMLGLLIALGSIALLVMTARSGRPALLAAMAAGLVGVMFAGVSGIGFLNNYGADRATYLMSIGFSVAVASYAVALFLLSLPVVRRLEREEREAA